MTDYLIAPSLLSADFSQLGADIAAAEKHGADWLHIDIMDGHFVPNMSMGVEVVKAARKVTELTLDVHLMINTPENMIEHFVNAGADGITIHTEANPNLVQTLKDIKSRGLRAGVAINPGTPAEAVRPVLEMVGLVLVMTVNPGRGGQAFIGECMEKVTTIRGWLDDVNPEAMIEVDGGVNVETVRTAYDAGARVFVAGSAVFGHNGGIEAGMRVLREQLP